MKSICLVLNLQLNLIKMSLSISIPFGMMIRRSLKSRVRLAGLSEIIYSFSLRALVFPGIRLSRSNLLVLEPLTSGAGSCLQL
jgi:hypothetical protein